MSHRLAVGSEASPEEEKRVTPDQSHFSVAFRAHQDLTRLGTTPNMLTLDSSTNLQNRSVEVTPPKSAMEAPLIIWNSNQGPIIQPRLVGQATTSPTLMSWCRKPSTAHLIGVACVQGMALGSPVVPDEKRMLQMWSDGQLTVSKVVEAPFMKVSQLISNCGRMWDSTELCRVLSRPGRITTCAKSPKCRTLSKRGKYLAARYTTSWVKRALAWESLIRVSISWAEKLSAMDTTAQPALTIPR
mmetsp:Transcript_2474/g.4156  ORF Transcript_2474/g.4156 Transcript_2474/m.4156 type:complete len:243 (+) Transcript_2474:935-1663(+)